ncbi:MAG: DUF2267 domain-containing protein [Ferruginibacter sp.]
MALDFEKYAIKGNEFVGLVAEDLEVPVDKAGRIVRSVMHALRNRLVHEESFQLLAQLPMAMKGIYVDGWKFNKPFNRIRHLDDFLDEVKMEDAGMAGYDFGNQASAKVAVGAVFKALHFFVTEGEMNDIIGVMPDELKKFIKETIAGTDMIL